MQTHGIVDDVLTGLTNKPLKCSFLLSLWRSGCFFCSVVFKEHQQLWWNTNALLMEFWVMQKTNKRAETRQASVPQHQLGQNRCCIATTGEESRRTSGLLLRFNIYYKHSFMSLCRTLIRFCSFTTCRRVNLIKSVEITSDSKIKWKK